MTYSTAATHTRRLSEATVTGVLGEFDHNITFKNSGDFAIIFGPNGIGKTKFLEIIDALSNLDADRLSRLPFQSASLSYSDNAELSVRRIWIEQDSDTSFQDLLKSERFFSDFSVREMKRIINRTSHKELSGGKVEALSFSLIINGNQIDALPVPVEGYERWPSLLFDSREGLEALSRHEMRMLLRGREARNTPTFPEEFTHFIESQEVRLIETQRLVAYEDEDRRDSMMSKSRDRMSRHTIEEHSRTVREQLDSDLSDNSRLTQRLDSAFPRRMLEAGDHSTMTEEQIREQLADQNRRRARITEITTLGLGDDIPLPPGELTRPQIAMLELYLKDAEEKLESFASTVKKIDLLEEIVNARLLRKQLKITADNGLEIIRDLDGESIPLTALSSGEQHEIILMFDLLFNMRRGGLVLIDEPEISLHIAWQQKFISDVTKIARLVGFQFIIATHSPQIIDNFWPYAERLGPNSSDFRGSDSYNA